MGRGRGGGGQGSGMLAYKSCWVVCSKIPDKRYQSFVTWGTVEINV